MPDQLAARLVVRSPAPDDLREAARLIYPHGDPVWRHVPYDKAL